MASLLSFGPRGLDAGPVLKIESIDAAAYPVLEARAALLRPYPEGLEEPESRFTVRERTAADPPDGFAAASVESIQELPQPETRLYLVLVIDTTRSVPEKDFRRSIETAQELVGKLRQGESAAVYRINAHPLLASGFVADRKELSRTLAALQRTGRVTRLYDSLHSAVITAHRTQLAAGRRSSPALRERTAIVLLTDGRDEGSFLTDSDCVELAALSHSYDIPVYTILYGRAGSLAALTRLSARTGGTLVRGFDAKRILAIPDELRRPPARTYRIRFRSAADPGGFWPPGERVELRMGWNSPGSQDDAEGAYRLPFPRSLLILARREGWLLYGAIGLVTAIVITLLLLVIVLLLRSRRFRGEGNLPEERAVVVDADLEGSASPVVEFSDELSSPAPAAASDGAEDEDFFVEREGEGAVRSRAPVRPGHEPIVQAESVPFEELREEIFAAEIAREKRRIMRPVRETPAELYMRDYSYRMLQNALRQARRYSEARLVRTSDRRGPSEYDLFLDTTVLGSGRWANIHLADPSASPIHAKIRQVEGKFVLYDMLSAAGVFVNGRKILRPTALADGDRIELGRTVLEFRGVF